MVAKRVDTVVGEMVAKRWINVLRGLCYVTTSEATLKTCRTSVDHILVKWCAWYMVKERRILTEEIRSRSRGPR